VIGPNRCVPRVARLIILLLATWGLCTSAARAEPRRSAIALVTGGADPELHARLRAEIAALGWRVTEIAPGADVALAQVARRAKTLAVLRVGQGAEGIEVWVAPEVDAQASSEWIDVDARRPELSVLRAVEALRARFLELGIEPEATPAGAHADATPTGSGSETTQLAPAAAIPEPEASSSAAGTTPGSDEGMRDDPKQRSGSALWLGLASGVAHATTVGTPQIVVSGALRFDMAKVAVGLEVWWPLTASRIEASEGSADVASTILASFAEYRLRHRAWAFGAGLGGALAIVNLRGITAVGMRETRTDSFYRGLLLGRLACEAELSRSFRLRAETSVGVAAPHSGVRFGQSVVAYWGQPLLAASLGLLWAPFHD